MCKCQAFLSTPWISAKQRTSTRRMQCNIPPICCSQLSTKLSRRVFFSHILNCAATAALATSQNREANAADIEITTLPDPEQPLPPPQSRVKPKKVTWGYAAENGPEQWGLLSDEWALCSTGRSQSPIAFSYREAIPAGGTSRPTITTASVKHIIRLKEVSPTAANRSLIVEPYIPPPPPIVGDAPPVDIYTPPPPAAVVVLPNSGTYFLRSIHFHAGSSEHVLEGRRGSVEAHFVFERRARAPPLPTPPSVNEDSRAKLSSPGISTTNMVGLSSAEVVDTKGSPLMESSEIKQMGMVQDGIVSPANAGGSGAPQTLVIAMTGRTSESSDSWLDNVVNKFVSAGGEEARPTLVELDLGEIIPNLQYTNFYQYYGSLTTPPGTEGVCWLVMEKAMHVNVATLEALLEIQGGPNFRTLQPLNDRKVVRFPALASNGK